MFILDTNVISALLKPPVAPSLLAWLDEREINQLYLPTIVLAEVYFGIANLLDGKRKQELQKQFIGMVKGDFAERILSFDEASASYYGIIRADRKRLGKPISHQDAQIAAIAFTHQAKIVTRNIKDFEYCGIRLINPFI